MPGQADALEDRNQIVSQAQCYSKPENTHLLCKGKYHWMADLLFDRLGFSCFAFVELDIDLQVRSNPNQFSLIFSL